MSDTVSYKPLIQDMTWSYSRIKTFEDCEWRWFLQYIRKYKSDDMFYASFGSFMHRLIENYYRGELTKEQMLAAYYTDFKKEVRGRRPKENTLTNYIQSGADYLRSFQPFPYNMVAVEKRVEFSVNGIPFVGYIDYIGEKDGELYVIDNKSRILKPRSGREKPTQNDKLLDEMLRQLYVYSVAVEQEYGRLPKQLGFNCFRVPALIMEDSDMAAYRDSLQWASDTISKIEDETVFSPTQNWFSCTWLCGVNQHCIWRR